MGNRAVITTVPKDINIGIQSSDQIGVYVHYMGSPEEVAAVLLYCKLHEFRPPETDHYGWARLCQVIGNYIGGGLGVGIDICRRLDCDNWDNGVYLIKDWEIAGRAYTHSEDKIRKENVISMLEEIDMSMPENEKLKDKLWKRLQEEGYESSNLFV